MADDDVKDSKVPIDLMPAEQLNRLKEAFSILGELTRSNILERIERLEGFKKQYDIDFAHDFEWKDKNHERMKALEDTKRMFDNLTVSRLDDHWKRIEKLESKEKYLDIRIIEQEQESNSKKVIDKQVWEDIKQTVGYLAPYYHSHRKVSYDTTYVDEQLTRITEAIKKVDPEWDPSI